MQTLTITRPDDMHLHVRDGDALAFTIPASAAHFGRAIIMPNLNPPLKDIEEARAYKQRICKYIPQYSDFTPLMTLYLTQDTTVADIFAAQESGLISAYKLYPAGATTNSASGVVDVLALYNVFEALAITGMPLLIHGEVVDQNIDIFDREAVFIERTLIPLLHAIPNLKVVLEHITTLQAVDFINEASVDIAATITPQHLLYNRNHLLVGGIKPHYYCLPILKRNIHQEALIKAAISGSPKFFLGTDSAPHAAKTKENSCGCAGCFSANYAMSLYAQVFDMENSLDKLEGFASFYGADFYGLPRNKATLTLNKIPFVIPQAQDYIADDILVNLGANETFLWQIADNLISDNLYAK